MDMSRLDIIQFLLRDAESTEQYISSCCKTGAQKVVMLLTALSFCIVVTGPFYQISSTNNTKPACSTGCTQQSFENNCFFALHMSADCMAKLGKY
jgi:hypothetical protein